jgi:cobalt-zinc-cadmium efflux system membrane fusion protein
MASKKWVLVVAVLFMLAGCSGKAADDHEHKEGEKHDQQKESGEKGKAEEKSEAHSKEKGTVKLSPEALKNAGIKTAPAKTQALADTLTVTATVSHNQDRLFHVTPRITGRVVDVGVTVGSDVKAGTVLAVLDSTELGQAKAEYLKTQTLLELARTNYEREKSLFDQKITAKKEVLAAEAEYRKTEAEARNLHERLRLYGLSDQAINDLNNSPSRYTLISPGSGIVLEREMSKGEVIESGKKVFAISDLSTVWVLLNIYGKDLARVQKGSAVKIQTESYPGESFEGKVTYIGDVMDPQSRTVPLRVEVPNPKARLKPGMFASAEVVTGMSRHAILISAPAVQKIEGKPAVFVQQPDGSFAKRDVELGREFGGQLEVKSGLGEGERVVVEGSFTLKSELLKEKLAGHED